MLGIDNLVPESADIGSQIPRKLVEEAGGADRLRTFRLGSGIKIHRHVDDVRIRRPVNGRRGFRTVKFWSFKCQRDVHSESEGEFTYHSLIEIHPAFETYRDQCDIVEIEDELGCCWGVPDSFALLRGGRPVWMEGKHARVVERNSDGLPEVSEGPSPKVLEKLKRFRRAFRRAGYEYVAVNESWTSHPVVAANVSMIMAHSTKDPCTRERDLIEKVVSKGRTTVADCTSAFAGRACPEEWVCAAMACGLIDIELDTRFSRASAVWPPSEPFWHPRIV